MNALKNKFRGIVRYVTKEFDLITFINGRCGAEFTNRYPGDGKWGGYILP